MRKRTGLWLLAPLVTAAVTGCGASTGDVGPVPSAAAPSLQSESLSSPKHDADGHTRSPIKHVIVIIGENRTFDHLFATYKSKSGDRVDNLLSKGIINEDGTPGPRTTRSRISTRPSTSRRARGRSARAPRRSTARCRRRTVPGYDATPNFTTVAAAKAAENGLADDYYTFLTTGGSGLPGGIDTRIANVQLALARSVPADRRHAHRRRLRRQPRAPLLPDVAAARLQRRQRDARNPSGCLADLFPWVEQTIAAGSNGKPTADDVHRRRLARRWGSTTCARGDLPYTKELADSTRSATTTTRPSRAAPAPTTSR